MTTAAGRNGTTRRLGRPADVDSAETHARLVDAARRCFARDGFAATTNRQIADAAGITSGAIYHYYRSKVDLYVGVYEEALALVDAAFDAAIAQPGPLVVRFNRLLDAAVDLNRRDLSIAGFMVGVRSEIIRHPELATAVAPLREIRASAIARLATEAAAMGELADGVDIAALEDLLSSVLSGLARFSALAGDAERHASAVTVLKQFFAGTLMKPPADVSDAASAPSA
jgi:AcrR family transcriptional regulator